MSLKLTILGCHSATPRVNAFPSSQILEIKNHTFLIDCGEGTQVQLRKYHIKFSKINHIFISHLHGDHCFGLVGLISTYRLLNRTNELHIYGPKGIKELITVQLKLSSSWTNYPLIFHELTSSQSELIFEDAKVEVHTIPLKHRVYTNGFLFREKLGERKLNMDAINETSEIEICDYQNLKSGKDYVCEDGSTIRNDALTFDPPKPLSYSYCSDTAYDESIIPLLKSTDCLYHESTFLNDRETLAETTMHSTAAQAASIAKKAQVRNLILGHFSSRYKSPEGFLQEAAPIFKSCFLAKEGNRYEIFEKGALKCSQID